MQENDESMILYFYWGHSISQYYERENDALTAAKYLEKVAYKIENVYPNLAMDLLCLSTSVLVEGAQKDKSYPYFDKALAITLNF